MLRSGSGSFSISPRFQETLVILLASGELPGTGEHGGGTVDGHDPPGPAGGLAVLGSLRRSQCRRRRAVAAHDPRARPRRPASSRDQLAAIARVGTGMGVEVLTPHPPHLLDTGVVGAGRRRVAGARRNRRRAAATRDCRRWPAGPAGSRRRSPSRSSAHQAGVLEQAQVARHPGLRQAEDAGQFRDVEAVQAERPQQPQPRRVAEDAESGRDLIDIYKSICDDMTIDRPAQRRSATKRRCAPQRAGRVGERGPAASKP